MGGGLESSFLAWAKWWGLSLTLAAGGRGIQFRRISVPVSWNCILHTLIHTFSFEILLPYLVLNQELQTVILSEWLKPFWQGRMTSHPLRIIFYSIHHNPSSQESHPSPHPSGSGCRHRASGSVCAYRSASLTWLSPVLVDSVIHSSLYSTENGPRSWWRP